LQPRVAQATSSTSSVRRAPCVRRGCASSRRAVAATAAAVVVAEEPVTKTPGGVLVITYDFLKQGGEELRRVIQEAYGPDGLGIIGVRDIPEYVERFDRLMPLISSLAALPEEELLKLEDAESSYSFGWSHGKESVEGGLLDTKKGSYYFNPTTNVPTEDPDLIKRFPSYCRPNIWPDAALPELEPASKSFGELVTRTGSLIAAECDTLVRQELGGTPAGAAPASLERIVNDGRGVKSRLLHFFPPTEEDIATATRAAAAGGQGEDYSSWCGWHLDHGSLTGITAPYFVDEASGKGVECPDRSAGLYIRTRNGRITHVDIDQYTLAFQVGETTHLRSGARLQATPHSVRAACTEASRGVAGNYYVQFMQPFWGEPMEVPEDYQAKAVEEFSGRWQKGDDFGTFTEKTLGEYYGKDEWCEVVAPNK